jgi:hypothetical protein
MSFALDIQKFAQKCGKNADQVVRQTMFDLTTSIVERSPVGDPSQWEGWNEGGVKENQEHWLVKTGWVGEGYAGGRFRANWQLGIGSLPGGEINDRDKEGRKTIAKAHAMIPIKDAAGKIYYFTNNLPYAWPLEDGHSKQAPAGMVSLAKVEFQGNVNRALAKVNK